MPLTSQHRGIFWIILAGFWAPFMYACIRNASTELSSVLVVSIVDIIALLFITLWTRPHTLPKRKAPLKTYFLRGILGYGAFILLSYAVTLIPLTSVTVLEFSSPLIATLLAILFLKERMTNHKLLALIGGFVGVLIVLRPGIAVFHHGSLIVLLASILWAITIILIRRLSAVDHHKIVTFYGMLMIVALCLPVVITLWQTPSLTAWGWITASALGSTMLVICFTRAYAETEISLLMPFEFCTLIFATIVGYVLFHEIPDLWTYIGGAIILFSATYLAQRSKREPQDPSPLVS